jgi:hypothetical protein
MGVKTFKLYDKDIQYRYIYVCLGGYGKRC